jgi:ribosomal protein S6
MNEESEVESEVEDDSASAKMSELWDAAFEIEEPEAVEAQAEEAEEVAAEKPAMEESEAPVEEIAAEQAEDAPPSSLPPAAREAWAETPQAMRDAIAKREQDYEAGIQKYAAAAKRAEDMDRSLQPYQQFFAMNGGASQAIPDILKIATTLQMGTPQQKAAVAAHLIRVFEVGIPDLDNILSGQQPQQTAQMQQMDPQVAQMQQQLQQQQAFINSLQQKEQGQASYEIDSFKKSHEFFDDVALDMADMMDLAANRGQEMTMEEAYERACLLRPDIKTVIDGREAKKRAAEKAKAAVSISGTPSGPGDPTQTANSLSGDLAAAWDHVAQGGI